MSPRDAFRLLLGIPWIVFLVYWIAGAFKTRATREQESFGSRFAVLAIEVVGYLLVFNASTGIGFLGTRVLPRNLLGPVVGVVLTWSGIALAIWARYHLAEYWSARITIKEDHQLIRTGPYTRLRHPIYSGLVLATWLGAGHRSLEMCSGTLPGGGGILFQSEERRDYAVPAIRRRFPRAPEAHRFPVPTLTPGKFLRAES